MNQHSISRRSYLGATGVVLGTGLAGCTDIGSAAGLANSDAFNVDATFDLRGDGPGEPVTMSLVIDDNEFERTFQPGEEFQEELDSLHGDAEIEVEYEESVNVALEWSRPGIELHIEIEQVRWDHTTGNVEISFENEELTTAFDATLTLPEATTEITGTDTRTVQAETEYEIDISLTAEEDEVEGGIDVEWDDDEDDDEEEEEDEEEEDEEEEDDDVDEEDDIEDDDDD